MYFNVVNGFMYLEERYGIDIDELIVQKIKDFTSTPLCDTITYNKEYDSD